MMAGNTMASISEMGAPDPDLGRLMKQLSTWLGLQLTLCHVRRHAAHRTPRLRLPQRTSRRGQTFLQCARFGRGVRGAAESDWTQPGIVGESRRDVVRVPGPL